MSVPNTEQSIGAMDERSSGGLPLHLECSPKELVSGL